MRTIGALSYQRFHSSPEKMAYYTGLPDAAAFETLFTFLGASNETILSCHQVKAGNGGGMLAEDLRRNLFSLPGSSCLSH